MGQNRTIFIVLGAAAVAGLVALAVIFSPKKQTEDQRMGADAVQVVEQDKKILAGGTAAETDKNTEDSIVTSLVRLSYSSSGDVKGFIEKYLDHPSPRVRAAAVEAAGAFNDESHFSILTDSLKDKEPEVRVSALKALGRHQGKKYEDVLKEHLKSTGNSRAETEWGLLSLYRGSSDEKTRETTAVKLIAMLDPDKNEADADVAISALPIMPEDPSIAAKAEAWLRSSKNDEVAIKSFHYLAAHRSSEIASKLGSIPVRNSGRFATVLKDFVGRRCPAQATLAAEKLKGAGEPGLSPSLDGINCQ